MMDAKGDAGNCTAEQQRGALSDSTAKVIHNYTLELLLSKLREDYDLVLSPSRRGERQSFILRDLPADIKSLIYQFFLSYCERSGATLLINRARFETVMRDAGFPPNARVVSDIANRAYSDQSFSIDTAEFLQLIKELAANPPVEVDATSGMKASVEQAAVDDDDDDDEEEMPDEFK